MGVSGISCVWILPGSDEEDTGKHTVHGIGDPSTGISVYRLQILGVQGPGVERVSQTKISVVL